MASKIPWPGAGATVTVNSLANLVAAINAAVPGDTIELADGNYDLIAYGGQIDITKPIRIKSQNRLGAVVRGANSAPTAANVETVPAHKVWAFRVNGVDGGVFIEDIHFKWMGVGIDLNDSNDAVVQGNKFESCFDVGCQVFDCARPRIHMNEFHDPYLAGGESGTLTTSTVVDAQADYGVNFYGCINPKATHNYFFGVHNQACSFKEGNTNPEATDNTFEGARYTALFFGQNKPGNGPYDHTGLPQGYDVGNIICERNVFRPIQSGGKTYMLNQAIRFWHVDGQMRCRGNVIEAAIAGICVEGREGVSVGYASGTCLLEYNTVGGSWRDAGGVLTDVAAAGVRLYKGVLATIALNGNAMVRHYDPPIQYCFDDGGLGACPDYSETDTIVIATSDATHPLTLRIAAVSFDPDLNYAYTPAPPFRYSVQVVPAGYTLAAPVNENVTNVQTMLEELRDFINGNITGVAVADAALTARELAPGAITNDALSAAVARRAPAQRTGASKRKQTSVLTAVHANAAPTILAQHNYTSESNSELLMISAAIFNTTVAQNYHLKLKVDGVEVIPEYPTSISGATKIVTGELGWRDTPSGEQRQALVVALPLAGHAYNVTLEVNPPAPGDLGTVELYTAMIDIAA